MIRTVLFGNKRIKPIEVVMLQYTNEIGKFYPCKNRKQIIQKADMSLFDSDVGEVWYYIYTSNYEEITLKEIKDGSKFIYCTIEI